MRAARSLATTVLLLPAFVLLCCVSGLRAEPAPGRAALLIANAAYPDSDAVLPTPAADAQALADELKRRGFSVEIVENELNNRPRRTLNDQTPARLFAALLRSENPPVLRR